MSGGVMVYCEKQAVEMNVRLTCEIEEKQVRKKARETAVSLEGKRERGISAYFSLSSGETLDDVTHFFITE